MPTTVDVSGLARAVETRAGFIARRVAIDLRRDLIASAKPHYKTGQMERHMKVVDERISPTVWRITASNDTIQASTTDGGAKPHRIPKSGYTTLRWVSGGQVIFARYVKEHPGNKGSGWFRHIMNPVYIRGILSKFVGR